MMLLICQQIWKTQQCPQDWKKSVFISVSKKGNAKECSNYHAIVFISQASQVMLKSFKLGFSIVDAAVDVFLELPCFLHDPMNVGNLISVSSASSKPILYILNFLVHVLLKPSLKDLSITWIACEMNTIAW